MGTNPTEMAARTYVALWREPDRAKRAQMIEACWAEDGRLVTRSTEIRGRAALLASTDALFADPRGIEARLDTEIDAAGSTFRFRAVTVDRSGTRSPEVHDAGIVDADGRIALILTFAGPLVELDAG